MKRILLGALLGGLVLFVWGAVSHMALPLGEAGGWTLAGLALARVCRH